jgi:hypothetical protein
MLAPSPMTAPASITANGADGDVGAEPRRGSTARCASIVGAARCARARPTTASGGRSRGTGRGDDRRAARLAASRNAGATMTQAARSRRAACVERIGEERDRRRPADSSGSIASDSRCRVADQFAAEPLDDVAKPDFAHLAAPLLAALGVERLDHLVGDVDLRAPEHGFLQDQVVLLGLEDLLDDAVGALDDGRELLVLALAQVFLELAPAPLQLAVLVDELALAPRALGLAERRRVLVELVAGALSRLASSLRSFSRFENSASSLVWAALAGPPRAARGRC